MAQIKSEKTYRAILQRIDELLPLTGDDMAPDSPYMLEMDLLCDMVEEYEAIHYPIDAPSRLDGVKYHIPSTMDFNRPSV